MLKTVLGLAARTLVNAVFTSYEKTDEEKLREIKNFFESEGVIRTDDGKWLIEQAEKVEELEEEIIRLKEHIEEIER